VFRGSGSITQLAAPSIESTPPPAPAEWCGTPTPLERDRWAVFTLTPVTRPAWVTSYVTGEYAVYRDDDGNVVEVDQPELIDPGETARQLVTLPSGATEFRDWSS
jgi:hypothetical protein